MNEAIGTPTGSRSGSGTVALERGHRVVGERSDGTAGEPRHPLGRLDAAARDERADGGQRVVRRDRLDRQVGRVGRLRDRPGLDPGLAVADLEQPPRPDAEERVAPEPLAALDRFEEIGRTAVVEAQEGADRGLEVGRARGAQQDRVRVGGEALGLRQADRIGCRHRVVASENQERPFVSGTKGRAFRGATLIRRCRTCLTDGPAGLRLRDRRRSALPCIAGALRRSLLTSAARAASCSVRRLPGPFPRRRRSGSHRPPDLWVDSRRVLVPFTARSFVMSAEYGRRLPRRQAPPRGAQAEAGAALGDLRVRRPQPAPALVARQRGVRVGFEAVDEGHDEPLLELRPGGVLESAERLRDTRAPCGTAASSSSPRTRRRRPGSGRSAGCSRRPGRGDSRRRPSARGGGGRRPGSARRPAGRGR